MKNEQKITFASAKPLKSGFKNYVYAALIVLGGVFLCQSGMNSPLSTEGRIAFEQNLIEAAYDHEEQHKREEIEAEKTFLLYDRNKKHE